MNGAGRYHDGQRPTMTPTGTMRHASDVNIIYTKKIYAFIKPENRLQDVIHRPSQQTQTKLHTRGTKQPPTHRRTFLTHSAYHAKY